MVKGQHKPAPLGSLPTSAEVEVMRSRAVGTTGRAVARSMGTYYTLVKTQMRNCRERLGANGDTHMLITAVRLQLLTVPLIGSAPTRENARWFAGRFTADLTFRQKETLLLAAVHDDNASVARALGNTTDTVKSTMHSAARQLGTVGRNRATTVLAAIEHGCLNIEDVPWPEWMFSPQFPGTQLALHCVQRGISPLSIYALATRDRQADAGTATTDE